MINPGDILRILSDAQKQFITDTSPSAAFDSLLNGLLELTGSEYGFIGEVLVADSGARYLKTHAITDISWNDETRAFYENNSPDGLEFFNLDSLFGEVIKTGETVVANDPANDPRRTGLPEGHPPLNAFLGLPIFRGDDLIGMAGIANRDGGYSEELATELDAYLTTCALLISNHRFSQRDSLHDRQLRHSEKLQKIVLDTVVDGIITIDGNGLIASFNRSAERIFQYTAEEVIGRNVNMLMPEPYATAHDGYIRHYRETGQARIIGIGRRVEGLRKNGETFPMSLAVGETVIDGETVYAGIVRDISVEKASELALQENTVRLQAVLDNVVDGIISIDHKGTVKSFNPAAERIFGYKAQEVIGNNVNMLMPEPFATEHDSYLHNYLETGEARIIGIGREVTGRRKDGSEFPMDLAVNRMEVGGDVMFSGVVRDITERKQMEIMKNEFISTVSHELRTPLTSIRGSLGLITGGAVGEVSPQIEEMLKIASNNTERLLILINDILDIQKMEAGKMAFRFENINLREFLENVIKENSGYASQHNVSYVLKEFPSSLRVFADKDRMAQVMANLLSNAAKFSREGDSVEVTVARHEQAIRISVTDHGVGISEEFHHSVFEKFTQSDSSDTRQKGGTGLGLSITRLIIEKHGGRIDFVSRVGVGTTFFFELPELTTNLSEFDMPLTVLGQHRPCVLIVEDDPDVAALLQRMLAESGYNSDIALNAREARWLLRERGANYKAMTLDIILPDEDGLDLLAYLRSQESTRNLPVVIVSVKADEAKRDLNGGAVGVMDWLAKPIDQGRLRQAIKMAAGPNKVPRVLHVEDEQDVHKVVSIMLRNDCEIVWTSTVEASREALESEEFDLVLLDIGLPDGSGLDLLETIERRVKPPRVVIFSAQDVDEAVASRVSGVLVKSATDNDLLLNTIVGVMRAN